jgi:hypothetical protein
MATGSVEQSAPALRRRAVDAVMLTASHLLGMEVVFVGSLDEERFAFARVHRSGDAPAWSPLIAEGASVPRTDSMCHQLLAGARPASSDVMSDPHYGPAAARLDIGLRSYVGVPITADDGAILGTLCGIDRGAVEVDDDALALLRDLAAVLSAAVADSADGVVIRRTAQGWQVGGETEEDLPTAMSLADLLTEPGPTARRPASVPGETLPEVDRLRQSVAQLEHALAARVTVEQAIGVLAERRRCTPRLAFEQIRAVARHSGARVHDLARDVVASTTERNRRLPAQLGGPPADPPPGRPVPGPPSRH